MNKPCLAAIAALPLILSACTKSADSEDNDDEFDMSINLDDGSDEKTDRIKIGGAEGEESKLSIKADGFSMDVDLPSITLDSDDLDLNNVKLYPGTKVTGLNIEDKDENGGQVTLKFEAPTSVETLFNWYETKMTEDKFTFSKDDNKLSGTTDDGDPFSLTLSEKSSDEVIGVLKFSESK